MDKIEMLCTQKILAHCTANEIDPKDFYIGFALIDIKAKNVELFGKEEADYLNSLVFTKEIENSFGKGFQLELMNKLQLLSINLMRSGSSAVARREALKNLTVMYKSIESTANGIKELKTV